MYSPDKNVFATIVKSTEYIGPQLQEEYENSCMCSGLLRNMSIFISLLMFIQFLIDFWIRMDIFIELTCTE